MRLKFPCERNGRSTQPRPRHLRSRLILERLERRDQPSFLVASAIASSGNGAPTTVAAADFNVDGARDLVVANHNGYVRVFQNAGSGTFTPTTELTAAGYDVRGITTGDFNNDGFADFATASFGLGGSVGRIGVFINRGDGTFPPKQEYNAGGALTSIVASDLTGDGQLDLAVTSWNNQAVSVLRGTGTGKFRRIGTFAAGLAPQSVAVGDFNGDTIPDLTVANNNSVNTVTVLLGVGGGVFQAGAAYPAGPSPSAVAAADFDGDGDLDLPVSNETQTNGKINVLLGNGDGSFAAPVEYAVGVNGSDIVAADLDADGDVDLAVADYNGLGKVSVLLGNGNGTFATPIGYQAGDRLTSLVVTELNGDSEPDIAVASKGNATVGLLFGTGGGVFAAGLTVSNSADEYSLVTADFNGDDIPDLAGFVTFNNGTQAKLRVSLGIGGGQFVQLGEAALPNNPATMSVGNINNDAIPDLLYGGYNATLSVLLGNGDGAFASAIGHASGAGIARIAVADLDVDGNTDVITANFYSDDVSILLGNGDGTLQAATNYAAGPKPISVKIGDFNGDSVLDLATANHDKDIRTVSLLLGNGDGTFQTAVSSLATGVNYPIDLAPGDFNADGQLDLAVAVYGNNGPLNVLLGNGDGTFQAPVGYVTSASFKRVVAHDFSGDGNLDLAITNDTGNGGLPQLYVLEGNGDGTFDTPVPYYVGPAPYDIVIADFNSDGRSDLAINNGDVHSMPDNVVILLNAGDWDPSPIGDGPQLDVLVTAAAEQGYETITPVLSQAKVNQLNLSESVQPANENPQRKPIGRIIRALAKHSDIMPDDIITGAIS